MRSHCGSRFSKSGEAEIPNGDVPYSCRQGGRCPYTCDFLYSRNSSVPALACTYTEKWIYYESRDELYEEMEVDLSTLCTCKYDS